ncbi:hypothetical protein KC19_8G179800 [Ceratodon purpureus]|uniref:Zinc finger HIT domain-containing protein 3 n=1 Tax=Ceratodon purpureus TaxID=3225 RepID=A0A8T0H296_CERPU|nr:hypothetical protein KC19_8G179800 [Ceratodon purpureus]
MGKQCEVCKAAESKYKCPSCLTPYCSLGCYKKHKEVPCAKSDANGIKAESKVEEQPAASIAEDDESNHRLKRSQLEAVAASEELRKMLRDRELQELITKIDSSPNPKSELEKAMEGPAFREFTDKLLSVISPMDEASV